MSAQEMERALNSYLVLDLTDEKGLLCGKTLGDLGADVIKIEPPGGSPARNIGPFYKDIPHPEKSLFWFFTNLNKRGITLDIETADGKEVFSRLVQSADFVVESFEPGYMDSLGLGYSELEKLNPRIIMTSITPFGQTGPYAHCKATDLVGVAMGGMVRLYGESDRPPNRISAPQFYFLGGLHGALGSLVAHYYRELTGEGQHVDVSCHQAVVLALMNAAEAWDIYKANYRPTGSKAFYVRPTPPGPLLVRYIFPCKDGYVFVMLAGGAQAGLVASSRALVEMANREGMMLELKDFDWASVDGMTLTQEEVDRREEILGEFLLTKTKEELFDEAIKKSIHLIPVNTPEDVVESPQFAFREFWVEVEHPELGDTITYPGWPIKASGFPRYRVQRRAPLIGEHNDEVYIGEMGMSNEQLTLLRSSGVI